MEEVRIYIGEQRGETTFDSGWVRSTLNYGDYFSAHRNAIGSLHHVNEWTGYGAQHFLLPLSQQSISVFIPLVGDIVFQINNQEYIVSLGSLLVFSTYAATEVSIGQSGSKDDNFVFQQFSFVSAGCLTAEASIYDLPIVRASDQNKLRSVLQTEKIPFQIYSGAFVGQVTDKLLLDQAYNHVLAITLDGNFEVEQRLLFAGDALFLPEIEDLEIECLSDTGVLLVLHF